MYESDNRVITMKDEFSFDCTKKEAVSFTENATTNTQGKIKSISPD